MTPLLLLRAGGEVDLSEWQGDDAALTWQ